MATENELLREEVEVQKREAHDSVYVATGEVTETARAFSVEKKIRLVGGTELARMLGEAAALLDDGAVLRMPPLGEMR